MTPTLLAFVAIVLFMIHEFEEIIRVCPWISKESNNPKYIGEMFITNKASCPSAETMATLILEEFILASLILLAGILLNLPELILAITLGHMVHLCAHITQAISFHTWVPGSVTAVITIPLLLLSTVLFWLQQPLNGLLLLFLTVLIFIILLANLRFLHSQTKRVESCLHS